MSDDENAPEKTARNRLLHNCVQEVAAIWIRGEDFAPRMRELEAEHRFAPHVFPAYVEMYVSGWRNACERAQQIAIDHKPQHTHTEWAEGAQSTAASIHCSLCELAGDEP